MIFIITMGLGIVGIKDFFTIYLKNNFNLDE